MRIGTDGTKIPGQVQFEVDTGQAVILFALDIADEEEVLRVVKEGFREAREYVKEGSNAGNGS
jgi:hypothetical protein